MLYFVPTPLGNLEDITIRALEVLKKVDTVFCEDTRVAKKLIQLLAQKGFIASTPQRYISFHEHNQKEVLEQFEPTFFMQNDVVYMSDAGMPAISDPGAMLVQYAQTHKIPYTVLPGPSAAITAFAASGFLCKEFSFYGFLPHKGQARYKLLEQILFDEKCAIVYEAPHRLLQLLEEIVQIDSERVLFLAKELTKMHETFYKEKAKVVFERLKKEVIRGEWVVVIDRSMCKKETLTFTKEELLSLPLPKKELAKLLAKITPQSTKEWYSILTKS